MSAELKRSMFDKVSLYLLLAVTALAPVFFVPASFISTQFGTSLLFGFGVIISILIYLVSAIVLGNIDLPNPSKYILGFTAVVPVVYVLAGISNGFSRMSFFGYTFDQSTVGFVLLSFAYMFLVSLILKNKDKLLYGQYAFLFSAIVLSLWLLARLAFGASFLSFGLFTSITSTVLGTWNNVGIFFGISAILAFISSQLIKGSKLLKGLLTLALVVSLFFVSLVNFSAVWAALGVVSFLYVLYGLFTVDLLGGMPMSWMARLRKLPVYPTVVLALSVLMFIQGATLGAKLSNKFNVSNVEVRPSFSTTMEIARATIKSKPLFGSGPNTFVTQWVTYKPADIITTVFWNTDFTNGIGLIPTFAVTTGIVGVLSWILFLGFYLYVGVKSLFVRMEDSLMKYLLASSFFVSLYLWIMTFVYVPSTAIFILTFFFTGLFFASIYVAGIVPTRNKVFSINPRSGFVSSLVIVVFCLGGVALGYGLFGNSLSLWYFQKSSYALNTTKDSKLSEEYMLKAIGVVSSDVYYRALSEIELYRLNEIINQDPKKVTQEEAKKQFGDMLSKAITAGKNAVDADRNNYLNHISLGKVYEAVSNPQLNIQGAYEGAGTAYQEAFRLNPKNPGIPMLFARLAIGHNDLKLAESFALQAIQLKNNYLDAYYILSQIEVATQNIQGAIKSVTAASVLDPTNPAVFFQLGLLKYNVGDWGGAIESLEKAVSMTPDYANAKYFLGLAYEITKQHDKAIKEFQDIVRTNPDNKDVQNILASLIDGKPIFNSPAESKPEKGSSLPVKDKN